MIKIADGIKEDVCDYFSITEGEMNAILTAGFEIEVERNCELQEISSAGRINPNLYSSSRRGLNYYLGTKSGSRNSPFTNTMGPEVFHNQTHEILSLVKILRSEKKKKQV